MLESGLPTVLRTLRIAWDCWPGVFGNAIFSSFAGAQKFTVGAGLITSFDSTIGIGFGINLGVEKLVKLGKTSISMLELILKV